MIQYNPLLKANGTANGALNSVPTGSIVFDLPGKVIYAKGVKYKGTDHTYIFSNDSYITLTNTPLADEATSVLIGINTSQLRSAIVADLVKSIYFATSAETVYKSDGVTTYTTAANKDLVYLLADNTKIGLTIPTLNLNTSGYAGGVQTVARNTNATHFLVFVDSNNSSAANEKLYTDGDITYNPSTNLLTINKLIVSAADGFNFSGISNDSENDDKPIWFARSISGTINNGIPAYSTGFKYNPSTDTLTVGNIAGQYIKIGNKQVALKGTYTPDTSITSSSTHNTIPSSKAVWDLITNIDAFVYKGILNGGSSTTYTPAANCGYVYKVATAGLINGIYCEVGDLFICNADSTAAATSSNIGTISAKWDIIQANATMADYLLRAGGTMLGQLKWNDTNALPEDTTPSYLVTVSGIPASGNAAITKYTSVTKFKLNVVSNFVIGTQTAATNLWTGALPSGVTAYYDGLSIDYYLPYAGTGTAATLQLGNLGAVQVYNGRGPGNTTTHIPANSIVRMTYYNGKWYINSYYDSNTTNTTGGDDTSSKLFIVGMTSQTTSNGYQRTYTQDTCYIGTDGCLYSGGAKVLTSHQSLANYVTLNTAQTITGQKTFSNDVILTTSTGITSSSITDAHGYLLLCYTGSNILGAFGNGTTATIATYIRSTGNNLYHRKGNDSSFTDLLIADAGNIVNNNPTLQWGQAHTIATIAGINLTLTMPNSPNAGWAIEVNKASFSITQLWTDSGVDLSTLSQGVCLLHINYLNVHYSGIFTYYGQNINTDDEIVLHQSGTISLDRGRIFAKIAPVSGTAKLLLAGATPETNISIFNIKIKQIAVL